MTNITKSEKKKLTREANKVAPLEAELQLISPPKIFDQIEQLCRRYLDSNKWDTPSRELVSKLSFVYRQEAFTRFGHDSVETFALAKLLKIGAPTGFQPPAPRPDALTFIQMKPNSNSRLDAFQESAAGHIIAVWMAFGRFLRMSSRGMEGGGGRGQVLHPLDVMGEELWEHYKAIYKPWQALAEKVPIDRKRAGGAVTICAIVLSILIEDVYPHELDGRFALIKGTALAALKAALSGYSGAPDDVVALLRFGKPPPDGQNKPSSAPAALPASRSAPQGPKPADGQI